MKTFIAINPEQTFFSFIKAENEEEVKSELEIPQDVETWVIEEWSTYANRNKKYSFDPNLEIENKNVRFYEKNGIYEVYIGNDLAPDCFNKDSSINNLHGTLKAVILKAINYLKKQKTD